jgi:hypothetical protein
MQPTNYVVKCYQGDDWTITIYPKDSSGGAINILPTDTAFFNIANARGINSTTRISGTATIQSINGGPYAIVASLSSAQASSLQNGYVYDIGFIKGAKKTTVLTGTLSVLERVAT